MDVSSGAYRHRDHMDWGASSWLVVFLVGSLDIVGVLGRSGRGKTPLVLVSMFDGAINAAHETPGQHEKLRHPVALYPNVGLEAVKTSPRHKSPVSLGSLPSARR